MSRVVPPSGERVEATKRKPMTEARALRIWTREAGLCYICGKFTRWDEAQIEHPIALAHSGSDDDIVLRVVHVECHKPKTKEDAGITAWIKRIHAREDGTRRPRAKIKSPGFPEWKGTWAKRKFRKPT